MTFVPIRCPQSVTKFLRVNSERGMISIVIAGLIFARAVDGIGVEIGGIETFLCGHGELMRTSGLFERCVRYYRSAGRSREEIKLHIGGPAYLEGWECGEQTPRMQQKTFRRATEHDKDSFWWRLMLASYLRLRSREMQSFCRYAIVAADGGRSEKMDAERIAVDRLYPHVVQELLSQNGEISMDGDGEVVYLALGVGGSGYKRMLNRNRRRIEQVFFNLRAPDEIDGMLLEALWKYIRFLFPSAKHISLEPTGHRLSLYRREIETVLELGEVDTIEIHRGAADGSTENIHIEELPSTKGLGFFGVTIDAESIRSISVCRIERLVLGISQRERKSIFRQILQGRIRESLVSLRMQNVECLGTDEIRVLSDLGCLKRLELEGLMSRECLRRMSESVHMAEMLQRTMLRLELRGAGDEIAEPLCRMEIEELEVHCGSVQTVSKLFLHAPGSKLARRLRTLSVNVGRYKRATKPLEEMPFEVLERIFLHVSNDESVEELCILLDGCAKAKIGALLVGGRGADRKACIMLIAGLESLTELKVRCPRLENGDLLKMLAGKERLERLVLWGSTMGKKMGLGIEDVQRMASMEQLRVVEVYGGGVDAEVMEALVENRMFVDRLERLILRAKLSETPVSAVTAARLRELGMAYDDENGYFWLDTGVISTIVR